MAILCLVFLTVLLFIFSIVAFSMKPTAEQNAIQQRISIFIKPRADDPTNGKYNSPLMIRAPENTGKLDRLIGDYKLGKKIKKLIVQSDKRISVATIMMYMGGLALGAFALVFSLTSIVLLALSIAAIVSFLPMALLRQQRDRRVAAFNASLPDCIEMCARSLRAGHSMVAAIDIVADQAVGPAKTEFGEVFKKQNYGLPLRDAFLQMLDRVPSPDLRVMVTGILVQKDTGGNLAEVLDRIASVIRDRIRIQGEIRTHTAQGRLTGWILFLLPATMLLAANIVNPGYSNILFIDPLGKKIVYSGITLLIVGGLLIRQIINEIEV